MAKQTIQGQQELIDEEKQIIANIEKYYKRRKIPEYQCMYIASLQKRIKEREKWIKDEMFGS